MKKFVLWLATFSWAIYTFYLTTIPNFSPSSDSLLNWILSNGGHFFFFGVLAVLLSLSLPSKILNLKSYIYAISLTSAYGLFIEFIQRSIPGRSFGITDWALDTVGAITFLYILKKFQLKS